MSNPLKLTELVFRDAHQSLLATRLRTEDMLPMAPQLDRIGYWSMESWGGATFDSCIRYLGEDPWDRLRKIKAAMPNTPQQMLLRVSVTAPEVRFASAQAHKKKRRDPDSNRETPKGTGWSSSSSIPSGRQSCCHT